MKTVIFDLDDTLLHDDRTLSVFTVKVFQQLHHSGFMIIAASGRAQLSMKPYVDQLSCVSYYIACNGAEIWDASSNCLLHRELIPENIVKEIAEFAESNDCYAHVYKGDSFFFNRHSEYSAMYAASSGLSGIYVGKLTDYVCEPGNKVILIDNKTKIASLLNAASEQFAGKASVTCSKPIYLEFNPLNASKGNAMMFLSSMLGFKCEEVIAFGDSLNDLSMLQKAGLAVTVSNGWEAVRPYCDFICESNNDDGPARFLLQHFLSGEVLQ